MTEEAQVTTVAPEQAPAPAQPVGPSGEAAGVAAVAATAQAPTEDALAKFQERLSRQQSILDRKAAAATQQAEAERQRAQALQDQLDQERMKGMTEAQRITFQAEKDQQRLAAERQVLAQERAALEEDRAYMGWFAWFQGEGVPAEKLRECADFPAMQQAYRDHMNLRIAAQGQPPAPVVGPADKVQTGGMGAPPSREWDRMLAEGGRPGNKKFRDQVQKQRRSGAKELI